MRGRPQARGPGGTRQGAHRSGDRQVLAGGVGREPRGPLLKLLLLTGCRLSEVAGSRRSELSGDGETWTIPGQRTKNGLVHIVPLPPLARDLIETVPNVGTDLVSWTHDGQHGDQRLVEAQAQAGQGDGRRRLRPGACTTSAGPPRQAWPTSASCLTSSKLRSITSPGPRPVSRASTTARRTRRRRRRPWSDGQITSRGWCPARWPLSLLLAGGKVVKPPIIWGMPDDETLIEIFEEQIAAEPKMYWYEGDREPSWLPDGGRRYVLKMTDWTNWQLDQKIPDPGFITPNHPPDFYKEHFERLREWRKNGGPEIEAAKSGDIEPLRRKYPHLVKFLHLAKRGKRDPTPPWMKNTRAKLAAIDVRQIYEIWKEHYEGKWKRRDEPSAVKIAADRWGVEVKDVKPWIGISRKIKRILSRR